jgi:hypothetical protein
VCASYTADWQIEAHAGTDRWSRAAAFIAKRRSREIDRRRCAVLRELDADFWFPALQYFIQGDDSNKFPYALPVSTPSNIRSRNVKWSSDFQRALTEGGRDR